MTRIALGLSYSGRGYQGWQSQPSGATVQDRLEAALHQFTSEVIRTRCAGRTDAGVHALMQVVHFDCDKSRREFSWVRGLNHFLPRDIAVQWAREVPGEFHAGSSAVARRYTYVLLQSAVRPSLEAGLVGWTFRALDPAAMREAAAHLLGEHDYSAFRASGCQARSPVKRIQKIAIAQRGAYWRFDFEANAFLHHMVRNIMGSLLYVGQGSRAPSWMRELLVARDRSAAAPTFAADGLYFAGPVYPPVWKLPETTVAYDWLP